MKKLLLIITFFLSCPINLAAETLFGISVNGILHSIDKSTATVTPIRSALPNGTYMSLLALNGKFYSFDISTGKLYKFGFVNGDELILGINNSHELGGMGIRPSDGHVFIGQGDYISKLNLSTAQTMPTSGPTWPNGQAVGRVMALSFGSDSSNKIITWSRHPSGWTYISWNVNFITGAIPIESSTYYGCCNKLQSIAIGQNGEGTYMAGGTGGDFPQPPWTLFPRLHVFKANNTVEVISTFFNVNQDIVPITAIAFNVQSNLVGEIPEIEYRALKKAIVVF